MTARPFRVALLWGLAGLTLLFSLAAAPAAPTAPAAPAAPAVPEAMSPSWVIVPGQSVGPIRLGMSQAELRAAIGLPERTNFGPWEFLGGGFAIVFSSDRRAAAIVGGDTGAPGDFGGVGEPEPRHRGLVETFVARTRDGLGMGSTRAEIVQALGEPDADTTFKGGGEVLSYRIGIDLALAGGTVVHLTVRRPGGVALPLPH